MAFVSVLHYVSLFNPLILFNSMSRAVCTSPEFAVDDCFMHILVKKEGGTPYLSEFSFRFNKIKCSCLLMN